MHATFQAPPHVAEERGWPAEGTSVPTAPRYTRLDLEPISFDDLPLGGEWTTRRRTISESDISLFAGVAGDFSPLTIEARPGDARVVPPALLVAMALGLGSMDMPIPSVAEWDWLNWKFPRPVRAGETIYARWTLTQKRPPVGGTPTSIAVWRVDVHTADGALCAEGEVGASVKRHAGVKARPQDQEATSTGAAPAAATRSRRRRRRATGGNGQKAASDGAGPVIETPAIASPPAAVAKPDRAAGTARRRRRRRSPAAPAADKGNASAPEPPIAAPAPPREAPVPVTVASTATPASPLSRVIRRLRRT